MSQVCVLVVVDVEAALTGGLSNHLYMIDNTGYFGSAGEGTNELTTACTEGQTVSWTVTPVDPFTSIEITGFSGTMVSDGICKPGQFDSPSGSYWAALVESQGQSTTQQYTMTLNAGGTSMSFDPYLKITAAP
jgi:hypothetical protein